MKKNEIPFWNCSLTYFEPTKVIYKGKICTVIPGTNNIPQQLPEDEIADAMLAEREKVVEK